MTQDRCSLIDNYNEGDVIKVTFDLRGREWNEKYFTNLNAWRIDKPAAASSLPDEPPFPEGEEKMPEDPNFENSADNPIDDLPF